MNGNQTDVPGAVRFYDLLKKLKHELQEEIKSRQCQLDAINKDLQTVETILNQQDGFSSVTEGIIPEESNADLVKSLQTKSQGLFDSSVDGQLGLQNDMGRMNSPTNPAIDNKGAMLAKHLDALGKTYLKTLNDTSRDRNDIIRDFSSSLHKFLNYRELRSPGFVRYSDPLDQSSIVSSIEFSADDAYFALAGVACRISIFKYEDFRNWLNTQNNSQADGANQGDVEAADMALSVQQFNSPYKISCVSWNLHNKEYLASADYDGTVTVLDVNRGQPISAYVEHTARVWCVDHSNDMNGYLASGGDDGNVKIWSIKSPKSITTIKGKANVCTVRFNPYDGNYLVCGGADHNAFYYDIRFSSKYVFKCTDHEKAISCARFLNSRQFITASTDGTLRTWDNEGKAVDVYRGHVNNKNFVGLSVSHDGDWISCGSENSRIYTYFSSVTIPRFTTPFNAMNTLQMSQYPSDEPSLFVSSVAWRRTENVMLAGNSRGIVRLFEFAQ